VHNLALAVTKDLHLNVVRLLDELLHKHLEAAAAAVVAAKTAAPMSAAARIMRLLAAAAAAAAAQMMATAAAEILAVRTHSTTTHAHDVLAASAHT
jgi:hypothetical protein